MSLPHASNLSEKDIVYFYNLLYLLEVVTKYEGFNVQRIDPNVKKTICFNSNYGKGEYAPKPSKKNILNFRGKHQKSKHLLKHIRNSFAHGLLESRGSDFYILDIPPGKEKVADKEHFATMIGIINKAKFYKMIKAILNTNPLINTI